jgi:hypothetical protein
MNNELYTTLCNICGGKGRTPDIVVHTMSEAHCQETMIERQAANACPKSPTGQHEFKDSGWRYAGEDAYEHCVHCGRQGTMVYHCSSY